MNPGPESNSFERPDQSNRPRASLGAGQLGSMLWRKDSRNRESSYRFTFFRMPAATGEVSQLFKPEDLPQLLKLLRLLATTLLDEGELEQPIATTLVELVSDLDAAVDRAPGCQKGSMNPMQRQALADVLVALSHRRTHCSGESRSRSLQASVDVLQHWLDRHQDDEAPRCGDAR